MKAEWHGTVVDIARRAADAIMAVYTTAFDVETKADNSPLTAADTAANRIIMDGLKQLTPDIPVLSEEHAATHASNIRQGWKDLWLVDPLDGTREFVKRNGEFTVNIALVRDGAPVFGVILQPVTGLAWTGALGEGAYKHEGDQIHVIVTRTPAAEPLRVAASRSHGDAQTAAFVERMPGHVPVQCGSSLKFCLIAEGAMDVYPRFGPTSEWDTAAGQAILEAAGGCLLDLKGKPFEYNRRETLLNDSFIALGDATLPWKTWLP